MKCVLWLLAIAVLIGSAVAVPVGAQDVDPIPACTAEEIAEISDMVATFSMDYTVIAEQLQSGDLLAALSQLDKMSELQINWWITAESLPRCSAGYEVKYFVGRLIDETLISLALISADEVELASIHIETMHAVSNDIVAFTQEAEVPTTSSSLMSDEIPDNPLIKRLMAIEGVKAVRMAALDPMTSGGSLGYLEIDLYPEYNNQTTAEALYRETFAMSVIWYENASPFEFSVILWDGESPAVEWAFDNETDEWRTTEQSVTPEPGQ